MKTTQRDIENWPSLGCTLIVLAVMAISLLTTPTAPVPELSAMEWRVTDASGETHTYPESAGWGCVSGGSEGGAFRVECRRWADGREAERVELVAVRLERVAAGDGAE